MRRVVSVLLLMVVGACTDLATGPEDRTPAQVYEELWEVFQHRYAPFEERGVDWVAARERHRPAPDADEDAVYAAATALLSELDDGHVTLVAPNRPAFVAKRIFRERTHQLELDLAIVRGRMVQGPFRTGAATFGVLDGEIGYVHVNHWEDPLPELGRVLDLLRDRRGVIVDLRHNWGGDFRNGFLLAERFADRERLAFRTFTKTGPGPRELGQKVDWFIEPRGEYQITTPTIVLVNRLTNSAAERTLMALQVMPHVTVVGSPTAGNHGEKVGGELSNGWRYSVVPQIVEDPSGRSFEGPGIAPHVRVDNTADEVAAGVDRQLDAALDLFRTPAVGREP